MSGPLPNFSFPRFSWGCVFLFWVFVSVLCLNALALFIEWNECAAYRENRTRRSPVCKETNADYLLPGFVIGRWMAEERK